MSEKRRGVTGRDAKSERLELYRKSQRTSTTPSDRNWSVHRGDIFNITRGQGLPTGSEIWPGRPAVIVSNNAINEKSAFVTVVYLTTSQKRDMPYHAKIQSGDKVATALCEQIFSVDKSRLGTPIGTVTPEEMDRIDTAIALSLSTIGVNRERCTTIIQKWIFALEKHNISILGNPAEPDGSQADIIQKLKNERDAWRALYNQQAECIQTLMGTNGI